MVSKTMHNINVGYFNTLFFMPQNVLFFNLSNKLAKKEFVPKGSAMYVRTRKKLEMKVL